MAALTTDLRSDLKTIASDRENFIETVHPMVQQPKSFAVYKRPQA